MDFFTLTHNISSKRVEPKAVQFGQAAYASAFVQPALPTPTKFKASGDTFERQSAQTAKKSPALVHDATHHPDSFFHFIAYHVLHLGTH